MVEQGMFWNTTLDASWGWVAGLIDGEGCISIQDNQLDLKVSNTHEPTLTRFKEIVNVGTVYDVTSSKSIGTRPIFQWTARGRESRVVIRHCLPVLVTKREQAKLGIDYQGLVDLSSSYREVPFGLWTKRKELAARIKSFNSSKGSRNRIMKDLGWDKKEPEAT